MAVRYLSFLSEMSGVAFLRIARASEQSPVEARSIPCSTEGWEELFVDAWAAHSARWDQRARNAGIRTKARLTFETKYMLLAYPGHKPSPTLQKATEGLYTTLYAEYRKTRGYPIALALPTTALAE